MGFLQAEHGLQLALELGPLVAEPFGATQPNEAPRRLVETRAAEAAQLAAH